MMDSKISRVAAVSASVASAALLAVALVALRSGDASTHSRAGADGAMPSTSSSVAQSILTPSEIAIAKNAALKEAAFTSPLPSGPTEAPDGPTSSTTFATPTSTTSSAQTVSGQPSTAMASSSASQPSPTDFPTNVQSVLAVSLPLSAAAPLASVSGGAIPGPPDEPVEVVRMAGSFVVGPNHDNGPLLTMIVDEATGESISVDLVYDASQLPPLPQPTVVYQR